MNKEELTFPELLTMVANTELSKDKAVIKQLYTYTLTNDSAILENLQEKVKSVALLEALNPYPFYIPTLDEIKAIATDRSIILGKYKGR